VCCRQSDKRQNWEGLIQFERPWLLLEDIIKVDIKIGRCVDMGTSELFRRCGTVANSCDNCSDLSISERDTELLEWLTSCVATVIPVLFAVSRDIVKFEVITAVTIQNAVFREMALIFVNKYHAFERSSISYHDAEAAVSSRNVGT
jgi:hypothetical protein